MDGNEKKYENPSFSPGNKICIHYYKENDIIDELMKIGIRIIMKWQLEYKEADGRITKDIVIIGQKHTAYNSR